MEDFPYLIEHGGARFARTFDGPGDLLKASASKMDALWRMWGVGVTLVRYHNADDALEWINAAICQLDEAQTRTQTLLMAELYAALALAQYEQGNARDGGRPTLEEAERRLRDLTTVALASIDRPGENSSFDFAKQICQMASALEAGPSILPREPRFWEGELRQSTTGWLIERWLRERLLSIRAEVSSSLVRLLARIGSLDDALRVWHETTDWIEARYVSPPLTPKELRSVPKHLRERLKGTQIAFAAKVPLWQLYMAKGDLDVAAAKLQESIASFEHAASCISVMDRTDLFRLMESRFNKANSLLGMGQLDEAEEIYREVEDAFREVGDPRAIKAVQHARRIVSTKRRERERADKPPVVDDDEWRQLVQEYLASLRYGDQ